MCAAVPGASCARPARRPRPCVAACRARRRECRSKASWCSSAAPKSNITTTVYTDDNGRFEFPKMRAGSYTLRVVRALEFKPYQKLALQIGGTAPQLDDIVLDRVTSGEFVPANWDIAAQLTGRGTGLESRRHGAGEANLQLRLRLGMSHLWADPAQPLRRAKLAADGHQDDPLDRIAAAVPGGAEPDSAGRAGHHRQMADQGARTRIPRTWTISSCPGRAEARPRRSSPPTSCRAC